MVQRRTHEADFREKWTDRAKYFNKSEVEVVKQNAWTSDRSFQDSMDAWKRHTEKDLKVMQLQRRRSQLQRLLSKETAMYEAELKGLSKTNYDRLDEMRDKSEEIKSARETQRKQIADDKMYEHWKRNNPDIRQLESNRHKKYVISAWGDQKEENQVKKQQEEEERKRYEAEMERERQAALEEERQKQESRLAEEKETAHALRMQMEELKKREAEAERLKRQQEELQRQELELEQLEDERKQAEERRKKAEMGRVLTRQYKAQLRRKAQQVQEALEMDRKILESLAAKEEEEGRIKTARKEKARADASWMKQVVEEQIRLEKAREAELDMLYRDEAARQWQKREAEWERERVARERLMAEVLGDRQIQIKNKMEENRRLQEESLQRREELLREMEVGQQLSRREQEEEERRKEETRRELGGQITERRLQRDMARLQLDEELQREKESEEMYEEMLRQEAARLEESDYEPKSYPRPTSRRSAWD